MDAKSALRVEREIIISQLNTFIANAADLGHREEAQAFETARNWLIRRQMKETA